MVRMSQVFASCLVGLRRSLVSDTALRRVLDRARAALAGHRRADDEGMRARRDEGRRRALAETSPQEWDEYRYWRLRALRMGSAW